MRPVRNQVRQMDYQSDVERPLYRLLRKVGNRGRDSLWEIQFVDGSHQGERMEIRIPTSRSPRREYF